MVEHALIVLGKGRQGIAGHDRGPGGFSDAAGGACLELPLQRGKGVWRRPAVRSPANRPIHLLGVSRCERRPVERGFWSAARERAVCCGM